MFLPFFQNMRETGVPVTLREYLAFLEGMKAGLVTYDVDGFYYLARTAMVKDERNLDRFDRAFARRLRGAGDDQRRRRAGRGRTARRLAAEAGREASVATRRSAEIEASGGFDKLMETLQEAARGAERAATRAASNGSAPPAPRPSAPMATTPKACASARTRAATAARSRSGTSASSGTSTIRSSSAPATSRSR